MKPGHVFMAAAFLVGGTALDAAAQQRNQPAPGTQLPPMERTPDRPAGAARERYERAMEIRVKEWEKLVNQFSAGAQQAGTREARNEADRMERAFRALKNQWQSLVQTQGQHWNVAREQFDTAYVNMILAWDEVTSGKK